eukprot:9333001-Pyramimonas_sp.AAC.1
MKAAANKELTRDGAIFIDRSPEHFDLILAHLRNKAEGLSYTSTCTVAVNAVRGLVQNPGNVVDATYDAAMFTVQLPSDRNKLRDIYLEAVYFQLPELRKRVCKTSSLVYFYSFIGEGGNPFDKLASVLAN